MNVVLSTANFGYDSLDDAFPPCEAGVSPKGSRILCQLRSPKRKTAGGILLPDDMVETIMWNTQVARVLELGDLAFRNRNTYETWPEGAWCEPGDYLRVPKYGGDRWAVDLPDSDTQAFFVIINDTDIIGTLTGDPLAMKAFI